MRSKLDPDALAKITAEVIEVFAEAGIGGNTSGAIAVAEKLSKLGLGSYRPTGLREVHADQRGKVSDKWESYFSVYDQEFEKFRDAEIDLLEIGVQNGGSLDVWSRYFPRAAAIVGCDIDPKCGSLQYADNRIKVIVGDANKPAVFAQVQSLAPQFDIIIDDGSHLSQDIVDSFRLYFPILKPGGVYVVEDLHAVYRKVKGGGILSRTSAMEFFKTCAELPNFEQWGKQIDVAALFATFFPDSTPSFCTDRSIESVAFLPSMAVVRKSTSRAALGQRVVVGSEASVFPGVLRHKDSAGQ